MKKDRAFDIQIIPHDNENIKIYTISRLKMRLIYLFALIFILGTTGIIIFYSLFAYFNIDYKDKVEKVKYLEKRHEQVIEMQKELIVLNSFKQNVLEIFSSSQIAGVDIDYLINSEEDIKKRLLMDERFLAKNFSKIPNIMPAAGWITAEFIPGRHFGIDISAREGTPFLATADGIVLMISTSNVLGDYVILEHDFGFMTKYAHSSKITVKEGEQIKKGQIIGFIGSTGMATGPHLHYEIIKEGNHIDPKKFIKKYGNISD